MHARHTFMKETAGSLKNFPGAYSKNNGTVSYPYKAVN
jgi:hypothetical protein